MTGTQLQDYLQNLGIFKIEPVYIVEVIDGYVCGRVPSLYQTYLGYGNGLSIRINYHTTGEKYVDFTYGSENLYASYKLSDLDFKTLYLELNKIIGSNQKFIEWSKVELRNHKIESLYEI